MQDYITNYYIRNTQLVTNIDNCVHKYRSKKQVNNCQYEKEQ